MDDSAQAPGGPARAFELAVGALSRKERTEAELRAMLLERGVEQADAEDALTRLVEIGELDDERFAERYAGDKRELRGWGPERIRESLVERGIPRPIADRVAGGEDPHEQAERAAQLLLQRPETPVDEASRGRALAYLSRRGYDYDVAYEAVRLASRATA